jgi:hypothetical protein
MKMKEVVVESYTLCDKCGIRISITNFDAFEFKLEHRTGDIYPGGGSGDKHTLDLCKECAPKAIKLLEENGFKIQHYEWD